MRQIYALNPLSVARYRERHNVARAKSNRVDAELLANILRIDRHADRALPTHSERRGEAGDGMHQAQQRLLAAQRHDLRFDRIPPGAVVTLVFEEISAQELGPGREITPTRTFKS